MIPLILLFVAGAAGALVKDILKENEIELPKKIDGKLALGFLGGTITGGVVGVLVDQNPTTAFLAGYAGTSAIESLLIKPIEKKEETQNAIENIIRMVAKEESVDPDLAVRVAKCESNLNPKAKNINTFGSIDRGLYQINSKLHPEVSDEQAFDPIFSAKFFCKAFKNGNLKWWDITRKCWEK